MNSNEKAKLVFKRRRALDEATFVDLVVWRVPAPVRGSGHEFKYRFAYVENEVCVLRYDNEAGKGDHKHIGDQEFAYVFRGVDQLTRDFMDDVSKWRRRK